MDDIAAQEDKNTAEALSSTEETTSAVSSDIESNDSYDIANNTLLKMSQDIYTNIAQISFLIETGNISEKEFYDFLDITYCGATPPASYISPKDIVIYSINDSLGRGVLESINDNVTSDNITLDNVSINNTDNVTK